VRAKRISSKGPILRQLRNEPCEVGVVGLHALKVVEASNGGVLGG
jgi:hypothetical protein